MINGLLVTTAVVVVAGIAFANPFVMLLAGDFAAVPGKVELTVLLTRVMMPILTLVALAAAAMGMLNSMDRYFIPALAPAVFNVLSIVTTIVLVPVMPALGLPVILSVAIGVLVGGIGQIVLQLPPLYREGFRYEPHLHDSKRPCRRHPFPHNPLRSSLHRHPLAPPTRYPLVCCSRRARRPLRG